MNNRQLLSKWKFPHLVHHGVTLVARTDAEKCLTLILEKKCRLYGYDGFTVYGDGRIQPHMEWSASWAYDRLPPLAEILLQLGEPPATVTHYEFVFANDERMTTK